MAITKPQRDMLRKIAMGADPNVWAQLAILTGKAEARSVARTMLSLHRQGYLESAKAGGLQISDKGRAAVDKTR